ncbi:ExbD/TolR family protein [Zavarzinia compransoris]|uniref:Protein TolR n=1 Tax=Zavarzinia compransoris TaxID=1264899 RepID=A0A317E9Q8_9PROT|nr:ExbD/TolR family protein [Zavarzinia compransoris]PWR21865.1 protein TolR [Zavarzinia compransoris]TDP45329.1 biopolymer transport protein TolR [Zavarzinia compransoris]
MAGAMLPGPGGGDEGSLYRPVSDINVTPFVDVMLVLLIIFMVAAPLMMVGVPVQLPKTSAAKLQQPEEPLIVSIDAAGKAFIDKEGFTDVELLARLKAMAAATPDRVVYVRGDKSISFGRLMEVMGVVSTSGFAKLSMIAETAPVQ